MRVAGGVCAKASPRRWCGGFCSSYQLCSELVQEFQIQKPH
jgi:hypothetical protein